MPLDKEKTDTPSDYIVRTAQKGTYVGKYGDLRGVAQRERRHSSFVLDALMVVEVDIPVDHFIGLGKSGRFVAVNTLCFQDGEEIFGHGVVVWVPPS